MISSRLKPWQQAQREGVAAIALVGGVAANQRLRQLLSEACWRSGHYRCLASPVYCTDNAAMIGVAALPKYAAGDFADLSLNAEPRLAII